MMSELADLFILAFGALCGALFMYLKLNAKVQDHWQDAECSMRRHRVYADSVVEQNRQLNAELVESAAEVERLKRVEARQQEQLASRTPPIKK